MGDFIYALKMLALTALLVLLMQIRVGSTTIEQRALAVIRGSPVVGTLNDVAHGAVKAMVKGYRWAASSFDVNIGKAMNAAREPVSRFEGLGFRRTEAYEKAQKLKELGKDAANSAVDSAEEFIEREID